MKRKGEEHGSSDRGLTRGHATADIHSRDLGTTLRVVLGHFTAAFLNSLRLTPNPCFPTTAFSFPNPSARIVDDDTNTRPALPRAQLDQRTFG